MTDGAHHPGEVLAQQLKVVGVSPTELARQIGVPAKGITQIISGKRRISGDSALRLAHWFGNQPEFWMACRRGTTYVWPNPKQATRSKRFLPVRLQAVTRSTRKPRRHREESRDGAKQSPSPRHDATLPRDHGGMS